MRRGALKMNPLPPGHVYHQNAPVPSNNGPSLLPALFQQPMQAPSLYPPQPVMYPPPHPSQVSPYYIQPPHPGPMYAPPPPHLVHHAPIPSHHVPNVPHQPIYNYPHIINTGTPNIYNPPPPHMMPLNPMGNVHTLQSIERGDNNNPENLKVIEDYIVSLLHSPNRPSPQTNDIHPMIQKLSIHDSSNNNNNNNNHEQPTSISPSTYIMNALNQNGPPPSSSHRPVMKPDQHIEDETDLDAEAKREREVMQKQEEHKRHVKAYKRKLILIHPKNFDALSEEIRMLHHDLKPNQGEFNRRLKVLARLQKVVQKQWPEANASMHLFGSSANNFGMKNADLDISLIIDETKVGNEKRIVTKLSELLRKKQMKSVMALPKARVPIVKFYDPMSSLSCDICINNALAIHNTRLISAYSKVDLRVRQLGYTVKHWVKQRQINEPYQGTLSSYAYILMVIHFLQNRNPPILPVLQQMTEPGTERTPLIVDTHDCYFYNKIEKLKDFGKSNTESVGELLAAFFRYYASEVDYENSVISVRTGRVLTKVEKGWNKEKADTTRVRNNFYFTLEDPFEISHNLGRVVDKVNLKLIKYEFMRAYKLICGQEKLSVICEPYDPNN